eukprot:1399454-Amphidinium_carterae.1
MMKRAGFEEVYGAYWGRENCTYEHPAAYIRTVFRKPQLIQQRTDLSSSSATLINANHAESANDKVVENIIVIPQKQS